METINYQGEDIEVEPIGEINTVLGEGTDSIVRDDEGRYYFIRHREPEHGDFCEVHRVNVNAAILWAIDSCGHNLLRQDAANLLMAARAGGYTDPWPADSYHKIKAARGKQSAVRWVTKVLAGTAMSTQAKPRAQRETVPDVARALPGVNDLDEQARQLLAEHRISHPEDDSRDVLNAAVEFLLFDSEASDEVYLLTNRVALARAKRRRLANKPTGHTLAIHLSETQYGMLRQVARYDDRSVEDAVMCELRDHTVMTLVDCYGHSSAHAYRGWDGHEEDEAVGCLVHVTDPDGVPQFDVPVDREAHAMLDRRAKSNGTDFATEFLAMIRRGVSGKPGRSMALAFELDHFHADLLRAFERRHNIDPETYARAIVAWHLEDMYDIDWNGGETEPNVAACIRADGNYCEPLTAERLAMLCHAAGLNLADYPDVGVDEDEEEDEEHNEASPADVKTEHLARLDGTHDYSHRQVHDPEDVALLAAAAPEPIDAAPLIEEEHVENNDDPTHIRTVLLDLAADWRAKAHEARTGANDLTPFNAAHKLHGQADLLDLCASALVATLHGKGGK